MKTIMKFSASALFALMAVLFLAPLNSCTQEESIVTIEDEIPSDVVAKLDELGLSSEDLVVTSYTDVVTGEFIPVVYMVEGDIMITPEQLDEMVASEIIEDAPMSEQYRTNNLVNSPRTVRILGFTGTTGGLDIVTRSALYWAWRNYDRLNLELNFELGYGTDVENYDIVVRSQTSNSAGGSAGFPTGGNPFGNVTILSGTTNFGEDVVEHVLTHEIGHCLGLRHTDYFNRSLSCGVGGNEGDAGVGAVHIPGTPTGNDVNSIMRACFNGTEDGELGANDITALRFLY